MHTDICYEKDVPAFLHLSVQYLALCLKHASVGLGRHLGEFYIVFLVFPVHKSRESLFTQIFL